VPGISPPLELQSAFTRSIGQSLDAAVIRVPAAVENDLLQTLGDCPFGYQLPDAGRLLGLIQTIQLPAQLGIHGGRRRQSAPLIVVDHLGVDVLQTAKHIQARPVGRAVNIPPDALMALQASELTHYLRHET
jgi:hypothetical protein